MKFYIDFQCQNITKKVLRKQGECIFGNENPSASGALRWAPDPWPTSAHFARTTLLRYFGNIC